LSERRGSQENDAQRDKQLLHYTLLVVPRGALRPDAPRRKLVTPSIWQAAVRSAMHCHVINLDRCEARWTRTAQRLSDLGVSFSRAPAHDGALLSPDEIAQFTSFRPRHHNGPWLAGQVGCFLSHLAVWSAISRSDAQYHVVLEDDMVPSESAARYLTSSDWVPANADILRLETSTNRIRLAKPVRPKTTDREVHRVRSTAWCAGAYIITKHAAQTLIQLPPITHEPVDLFLFSFEHSVVPNHLSIYQLRPAAFIQEKYHRAHAQNPQARSFIEVKTQKAKANSRFSLIL
jgi:glycosyl transferase family 25